MLSGYRYGFYGAPLEGVLVTNAVGQFDPEWQFLWRVLGTTTTATFKVTNYTASEVVLGSVNGAGVGLAPPFGVSGGSCVTGLRLASHASCSIAIAFSPTQTGAFESSFSLPYTVQSTGASGQTKPARVRGAGTEPVMISDSALNTSGSVDLGALSIGSSIKRVLSVTNWQPDAVVLGATTVQAPFSHLGGTCASGAVLQGAGANCTLEIGFAPSSLAAVSGSVELVYRPASGGAQSVASTLVRGSGAIRDAVTGISVGYNSTCARLQSGAVRCWGRGDEAKLGYGNRDDIGDDEFPLARGNVNVGGSVVQVATGRDHTCAVLSGGKVRCWGSGSLGALGYGNPEDIGDNETPAAAGDVNIGGRAVQVAVTGGRTCAVLDTGDVRCWGNNYSGELGYGHYLTVWFPASAGVLDIGGPVAQMSLGPSHMCALLANGRVRCWGQGEGGKLGYADTNDIGGSEVAGAGGDVDVGGQVTQISAGKSHTCAVLSTGKLRCWGDNSYGALGYPMSVSMVGDDETPASVGDVALDTPVRQVAAGESHTCVLLTDGNVRCWGDPSRYGLLSVLGYGTNSPVTPASAATDVNVGGSVAQIATDLDHTCALLTNGAVRCWGRSFEGALGYPSVTNIGDDELPFTALDVAVQ